MIPSRAMSPRGGRVAALLVSVLVAGTGWAEVVDRIVATIDGEPVTAFELHRYAEERGAEKVQERTLLDALITDKLLEKEIATLGIAARDEEVGRYIDEIKARNGMDDERFRQALATQGLTMATYRARVKAEIEKSQLVNREIRQRVNVSPQEIERYYQTHLPDYATSARVRVRDIFFSVAADADEAEVAHIRAKADEVRQLARDGRDFGALARQFSEGPGADKGGDLGSFERGQLDAALEDTAFRLKPGEVSEPIRTATGFHLLRAEGDVAAGHKPLDEVKDSIREALYNEALESRFQQWLSRDLRERHHVEVME
jgi:peptidyl-prolyl cis-trans isomerase SurA